MADKLFHHQKSSTPKQAETSQTEITPTSDNLTPASNRQFSPGQIMQMQRIIGNKRTQHLIQKSHNIIQRDPDGLIELAPGVHGEVGIEGKIKEGTVVTKTDNSTYTVPAEAPAFVHDIQDKHIYFVQIPGYIVDRLGKDVDVSDTKLNNKDNNEIDVPVRSTVRKKDVERTTGQFEHKKIKTALFPHPPVPDDIEQRTLANCYFLAALGSVAAQHPAYLTEMMSDGEDTISVRFYRPEKPPQTGFKAEYVTVRKSVVKTTGMFGGSGLYSATSVPWPALATKAYAAWDGHDKAGLPGFGGTYEGTAYGAANSVFEHILGEKATKEDIRKSIGSGFVNTTNEDDQNLILPGHPKRPIVQPWDRALYQEKSFLVAPQQYTAYLTENDSALDKAKAFLQEQVLGPVNIDLGVARITPMGTLFRVKIPYIEVMKNVFPGVGRADVEAWANFVNGEVGQTALRKVLEIGDTPGIMDRGSFQQMLRDAGVSDGGKINFLDYVKDFIFGTPSDPYYNPMDLALYTKISEHLESGGMVTAQTPEYGKGGGQSGNEDIETVPGIAGGHVYTVLGIRLDEDSGRRFITLRNPWGNMGMGYSKDFTKRKQISSGVFELEFSDFVRYFKEMQYSASSPSTELAYNVAEIMDKQRNGNEN